MEKGSQYLYEYQQGKRMRNIGFMKIEKHMDKSTIQVYGKQLDEVKGILFQRGNGDTYLGCWEMQEIIEKQEAEEYIPQSRVVYEKIQRQDLARLPRKEWKLANNSFLLHGFSNYHHLLYIEEDEKIWIGVPGIYHEKEQVAATAFGFGNFRRMIDVDIELTEEEKNTIEDFGYWCRQILLS